MPAIQCEPGIRGDKPRITGEPYYAHGLNIRFRPADGMGETVGFVSPMRAVGEAQVSLPGGDEYRSILTSPSSLTGGTGQILTGSSSLVQVIDFDPASQPTPGTRWRVSDITPAGFDSIPDTVPTVPTGAIEVPPNVHFVPQDDIVVILKANDPGNPPWQWDRNVLSAATDLATAPKGAVGAAIVNRILVLLGAQSVGETGQDDPQVDPLPEFPQRFLTVRWSNQFEFENWNQSDVTLAGELQLDHGSRIVGGGNVRQGIAVWTDESLWILTFTTDTSVIFAPKVVDGSTGLMSNQAWTETEGRIWYFDTNRRLMVYDGGSPRAIPNPSKLTTIENLSDTQIARAYMFAAPEYDEVGLSYPTEDGENADSQIVYNYALNCWYPWRFSRTAWHRRKANIPSVAIDPDGLVYFHEVDSGIGEAYALPPSYNPTGTARMVRSNVTPNASDVIPFDFAVFTNPFHSGEVTTQTMRNTRLHWDMLATSAEGLAQPDTLDLHAVGYGLSQIPKADVTTDVVTVEAGDLTADVRVSGKAIQLGITGDQIRTQVRFGAFSLTAAKGGTR